jgi:hypothetical protein
MPLVVAPPLPCIDCVGPSIVMGIGGPIVCVSVCLLCLRVHMSQAIQDPTLTHSVCVDSVCV